MYKEFLPLGTLSLHEGVFESRHRDVSRVYFSHLFGHDFYTDRTTSKIIYSIFGCAGDADDGRLINLCIGDARCPRDKKWSSGLLPVAVMMSMPRASMKLQNSSSFLFGLGQARLSMTCVGI